MTDKIGCSAGSAILFSQPVLKLGVSLWQGCNARKVNCGCVYSVHIETSSLWAEFVNNNRCICSVHLNPRRLKALNFDNFDNSRDSFL